MLSNMACSLIKHKRITTTLTKAKQLRVYIEPIITRSKTDSTHSRRMTFRKLQDKSAVTELFREIGPKVESRCGGYVRILKTDFRQGDAAEMCFIELVDFNDTYTQARKDVKKQKSRRSRRGGGGSKKAKGDKTKEIISSAKPSAKSSVKEDKDENKSSASGEISAVEKKEPKNSDESIDGLKTSDEENNSSQD